jgi:ornithine carbamoyltransferase
MRHVLSLFDLSTNEIRRVLDLSKELKQGVQNNARPGLLANHTVGLLFEKPSLRTRVSFECLTSQLGGNSLFLGEDVGWGKREPVQDFIPILTSYLDVLVIRAKSHDAVAEACEFSRCPIINGLTDVSHPCQALADMLTIQEHAQDIAQSKVAFLGDGNNVAYSLAIICSRLGVAFSLGAPKNYQFDPAFVKDLNAAAGKELVTQTEDPSAAVKDAEFVYTDVWTSMGQEAESQQRLTDLADYQVNAALMEAAGGKPKFLHCLPARRGEEVTTEVIESGSSLIIEQAANRLHAQKGLVVWLLQETNAE